MTIQILNPLHFFCTIKGVLSFAFSILFSLNILTATEVYKSKSGGMGANKFKQYSMVRTNTNDGFVYSGTTKGPNGQDVIHILRTDDNLSTVWSYYFEENSSNNLNSTKICKSYNGTGYWISGYHQFGGLHYPYIMQIDNNGTLNLQMELDFPGVFLDVEPTSDDGCIAVGFESYSIALIANAGRRGLITKFSSSLAVNWSRAFHTFVRQSPLNDNFFFENAENVTVIGNNYFVTGSVSYFDFGYTPPIRTPIGYYCKIDASGNMVYQNSLYSEVMPYDVVYDNSNNKLFFIGNFDVRFGTGVSVIGDINEITGALISLIPFEGLPANPYPHVPLPYKIDLVGNELWVFGYVRNYFDGSSLYTDIMVPFRSRIDKNTFAEIDFFINHTAAVHTDDYPNEDPGFLNARDFMNVIFESAPLYTPEMGVVYQDLQSVYQWGMVGYYNQLMTPPRYDLHLMSSALGECANLKRNLDFSTPLTPVYEDVTFVHANSVTRSINITRGTMTLDDDDC